jgi:hypothetical protein
VLLLFAGPWHSMVPTFSEDGAAVDTDSSADERSASKFTLKLKFTLEVDVKIGWACQYQGCVASEVELIVPTFSDDGATVDTDSSADERSASEFNLKLQFN